MLTASSTPPTPGLRSWRTPRKATVSLAPKAQAAGAVPAHLMPQRTSTELLKLARRGLAEAEGTDLDGLRYATAHLAALRAAAAVLAALARPGPRRRGRPTSVWALLTVVAPELSEWAGFFAAGAVKRAAAEAGIPRSVSTREADDLVRDAGRFIAVVESVLVARGQSLPSGIDGVDRSPVRTG